MKAQKMIPIEKLVRQKYHMQKRTWKTYVNNTRYPENYERKKKREQRDPGVQKTTSEEKNVQVT